MGAVSSPPPAFRSSRRRRKVLPRQERSEDPPVIINAASSINETDQNTLSSTDGSDAISEYGPPTYRARRRSASVASVHHFSDTDEVDEHGRLVSRERYLAPLVDGSGMTLTDEWERETCRAQRRSDTVRSVHRFPRPADVDEHGRFPGEATDEVERTMRVGKGLPPRMDSMRVRLEGGSDSEGEGPVTPPPPPPADEVLEPSARAGDLKGQLTAGKVGVDGKIRVGRDVTRSFVGVW